MKKFDNIKVISFDGDGTLWDFEKVMRDSLKYVLKQLNEIEPQASQSLDINKMIEIRNQVFSNLKGKETKDLFENNLSNFWINRIIPFSVKIQTFYFE